MSMLSAALSYRKRGWAVIPAQQGGKSPIIKWAKYTKRLPTTKEIKEWWTKWPDANVAIITGSVSNLAVIDVDPSRSGDSTFKSLTHLTKTPHIVETGSGGHHHYYQTSNGRRISNAVDLLPGIDVRGEGGIVIAPPSLHESGNTYSWVGGGEKIKIPTFPDLTSELGNAGIGDQDPLIDLMEGVGEGERNDSATRLAGYCIGKDMSRSLTQRFLELWNAKNDPPLSPKELFGIVRSVFRTHKKNTTVGKPKVAPRLGGAYSTIGWWQYMVKYGGPTHWLVPEWLPSLSMLMVVAPPGSFKTWMLQDLAVSVAGGLPFLGRYPVNKQGPVLFMQQEDWHGQIVQRFAKIVNARYQLDPIKVTENLISFTSPPKLPIFTSEHDRFRFDDSDIVDSWVSKIEEIRPTLVVLDPLYSAGSLEEFMAATAQHMFLFKDIRQKYKCTFVIAHHTSKNAISTTGHQLREQLWGSQFLNAWTEGSWHIRRSTQPDTAVVHRFLKGKGDMTPITLKFNISDEERVYRIDTVSNSVEDKGVDLLGILEQRGPQTNSNLARLAGVNRSTTSRRLSNLLEAGVVYLTHDKKYALKEVV